MKEMEVSESSIVYRNRWMTVREDIIQRESGARGIFGDVEKADFVVILAVESGRIHLVEQYRYPVQQWYWERPQGAWENNPEVDHAVLAAGELEEEVGLIASRMKYVGHQYLAHGYSCQAYHIYLAAGFSPSSKKLDAAEEGLISHSFSLDEFEQMILDGRIKDANTVNSYGLAKLKGML